MVGKHPTWTEVLGSVASEGKDDVSAYEAVNGQKMDHVSCSKEEAR